MFTERYEQKLYLKLRLILISKVVLEICFDRRGLKVKLRIEEGWISHISTV